MRVTCRVCRINLRFHPASGIIGIRHTADVCPYIFFPSAFVPHDGKVSYSGSESQFLLVVVQV